VTSSQNVPTTEEGGTPQARVNDDILALKTELHLHDWTYFEFSAASEFARIMQRWPLLLESTSSNNTESGLTT
jgi:Protein of unknown function (DUF2629).